MLESTLVYKVCASVREFMRPHIHAHGDIASALVCSDPFETIVKNVFIYNACSRLDDSFPAAYNAFKEKYIDGSSATNVLMLALYDVGNGVSRLRAFQKCATQRVVAKTPKRWTSALVAILAPGPLDVKECCDASVKCALTRRKAKWVLALTVNPVLRDWPIVPPTTPHPTDGAMHEVTFPVCTRECARLVMLHELNAFELMIWDLTAPVTHTIPPLPTHDVHAMHAMVYHATVAWDALHATLRMELAQKLATLVSAFACD